MANPEKLVTRDVVFEAAQAIKAAGEEPTNRKLLQEIGGGSMTTIAAYFREWKAQQSIEAPAQVKESEPVPDAVLELGTKAIAGVWQACRLEAHKEVEKVAAEANARVQSISEERDGALNELAESEKEFEAERDRVAEVEEEIAVLSKIVDTIRSERDRVVGISTQQEKEIARLNSELETVRQAAKVDVEKITIDREKIMAERDALQKDLDASIVNLHKQHEELENLKKAHEELKASMSELKHEKDSLSKDCDRLLKDNIHLEEQIKSLSTAVSEKDQLVGRLDEKNGEIMSLKGLLSECMAKSKADSDGKHYAEQQIEK